MQNLQRFDDYFFTICKETGGIEGVLHSMLSFLYRRTDFFYEADPGDKMGFLPGYSKNLLGNIFDQYQAQHYQRFPKKDPSQSAAKVEEYKKKKEAEEQQKKELQKQQEELKKQKLLQEKKKAAENTSTDKILNPTQNDSQIANTTEPQKVDEPAPQKNTNTNSSISTYNGGVTEKYKWSQSISDITLEIVLPRKVKSKELEVIFTTQHLSVKIKGEKDYIINGETYEKVKVDDSIWNLDEQNLLVTLEKGVETIWKTVIKGDIEIDATKVENSKPLESFDQETQGALRKIMYEQQRKQMGLPTTDEEKQMDALKQAWNAEGSPFKGQPFDPSKFNLSQGGMNFPPPPEDITE